MYCNHCGMQLNPKAKFCPSCGAKVTCQKGKKKMIYAVAALVFICMLAAVMTTGIQIIKERNAEEVRFVKTEEGVAIIESAGKYGIADLYGNLVIPCIYDEIADIEEIGKLRGLTDDGWEELDIPDAAFCLAGIPLHDDSREYYYVTDYDEDGYRWGIDQYQLNAYKINKKEEIEERYAILNTTEEWYWLAGNGEGKLLFKNGICADADYTDIDIGTWGEGLIRVKKEGKYGFINEEGREIVSCQYESVNIFHDGLAPVVRKAGCGYINKEGEEVVPCQYDYVDIFRDGLATVRKDGKYGCVDTTGKEVIPCQYDEDFMFSEGLAAISEGGKWGYINGKGRKVITCRYDSAGFFHEGLAAIEINGKYGYLNKKGDRVIACKYDEVRSFDEGLACVRSGRKYGYINKRGESVVPCQYDGLDYFSEGLARAEKDGRYGYVNKKGSEVISCQYEYAGTFHDGWAIVVKDGKYGCINKRGEEVISCRYNQIISNRKGLVIVEKGGVFYTLNAKEVCLEKANPKIKGEYELEQNTAMLSYAGNKECVGYGLCMGSDKIPYAYNGNYVWDMDTLRKTNYYMVKAFVGDKAERYMKKAYGVNKKNIFIAYSISKQYREIEKSEKAEKYKKFYNQKIEEIRKNNYNSRLTALNNYRNALIYKGEINKGYHIGTSRNTILSEMLYLLLDCSKKNKGYTEWEDEVRIYEEDGLIDYYLSNALLEVGSYITEEDFYYEKEDRVGMSEYAIAQAKQAEDSYRAKEKLLYSLLPCYKGYIYEQADMLDNQ